MKRLPIVAIVGKPNSGKSTLFNRITGTRTAITHASPGVTRDSLQMEVDWNGTRFELVDTGGYISHEGDFIQKKIKERIKEKAKNSAVIIFLVDVDTGITDDDDKLMRELREYRDRMLLVVNKVESQSDEIDANEFYKMGFETLWPISAMHGRGIGDLMDEVVSRIPRREIIREEDEIKVAVLGKPNVGKSSLVNAIVGEDRNIVSSIPGTTRDVINVRVRRNGKSFVLIDTAGVKRAARTRKGLDVISSLKTLDSARMADVVLVMLDASEPISRQDVRIASEGHRARKGIIVLLNKWDKVERDKYDEFINNVRTAMPFLSYAPVLSISALTKQRVEKIFPLVQRVFEAMQKTVPTASLNKAIEEAVKKNPPKFYQGGTGKIFYATQTGIRPPTFTLFVNKASYFHRSYIRYLNNQLRKLFTFEGTAIKISLRSKKT